MAREDQARRAARGDGGWILPSFGLNLNDLAYALGRWFGAREFRREMRKEEAIQQERRRHEEAQKNAKKRQAGLELDPEQSPLSGRTSVRTSGRTSVRGSGRTFGSAVA